jgi:hypothetical protein
VSNELEQTVERASRRDMGEHNLVRQRGDKAVALRRRFLGHAALGGGEGRHDEKAAVRERFLPIGRQAYAIEPASGANDDGLTAATRPFFVSAGADYHVLPATRQSSFLLCARTSTPALADGKSTLIKDLRLIATGGADN